MIQSIPLGQICNVTTGQSAPQDQSAFTDEGIPFIRAGSLEGLLAGKGEDQFERINAANAKKFKLKLFPKDTVIFAKSGMSAKIGRVYRLKMPCYLVSHLAAVPPSEKVDPGYLHRWFEKNPPARLIENDAYPSIKTSVIQNVEIPLPPLPEQRRIAAILDKADAIRRKRQEAIRLTENFLRSVFLDMFGDPVTNPKGWEVGTIRDLVAEVKYGTSQKAGAQGQYPILRMGNLTCLGGWDFSDLKYIDMPERDREKYLVHKGDLLFNRTNSKELVGKTAVFDQEEPMAYAGYLIRVRPNDFNTSEYISGYLNSDHGKQTLTGMCKSIVGMANINAQELQNIKILKAPLEEQRKYQSIVKFIASYRATLDKPVKLTNNLFNSLTQRAFRGDL